MKDKYMEGTPSAVLLPAKNYVFKVTDEYVLIELPRRGKYHDIDPSFFTEDDGEFDILDTTNNILYMPAITKVLFATKQYPDLKFNQFFVPHTFKIDEDKVIIVGQVIDMMLPVDAPKEEGE